MRSRIALGTIVLALAVPSISSARVDTACTPATAASAIAGVVKNAKGQALAGMSIELHAPNSTTALPDRATTDASGRYRICASGGSNTYDVLVRDPRSPGAQYAGVSRPYTVYSNVNTDADFTPESGYPMLYAANLTITPNNISTSPAVLGAATSVTVSWIVRSKAPASTTMTLRLDHRGTPVSPMATDGTEGGGVSAGGWNRWKFTDTFAKNSVEKLQWATVVGTDTAVQVTQYDRQPYVIDNQGPIFGKASTSASECGPSGGANAFAPVTPPGTTNPQPIVSLGVCDHYSNGARSGLDPFSLSGKICADAALSTGCTSIDPVLSTATIVWFPRAPLAKGDYYFGFTISDFAGNTASNPLGYKLTITDKGGQTPTITAPAPGSLGSGSTGGVVLGSQFTSPSSMPYVGFRLSDADGQMDLVPGSLVVRVYYGDEHTLVWQYDPTMASGSFDAVSKKGGALFDLSGGGFRATSFNMTNPGLYLATASVTDHGNNAASLTWQWIVAAAV